ncbi:MAG TPA: hypothetical protein VGH77_12135 [Streptosporangiaceae bacterium]|jgi:hypothetical protein
MSGAVIANWPIALLIIVAIAGVPLWLTFRRNHLRSGYRDAHAHDQVKESGPGTGEYVPADRVSSLDGLTVPHQARMGEDEAAAPWQSQ